MSGPDRDQILELDRHTLRVLRHVDVPDLFDTHQIDVFERLLWIVNTNLTQVIVLKLPELTELGRFGLNQPPPPERQLSRSRQTSKMVDARRRIHVNSVRVCKNSFYLGHFGIAAGDFRSSQLMQVPWKAGPSTVQFGDAKDLPVCGLRYPHNVFMDPEGLLIACDSGRASFVVGGRRVVTGGWPRGLAISRDYYLVGISSYAPTPDKPDQRAPRPVRIAVISRHDLRIVDEILLPVSNAAAGIGQIYEVRLLDEPDRGTSAGGLHRSHKST